MTEVDQKIIALVEKGWNVDIYCNNPDDKFQVFISDGPKETEGNGATIGEALERALRKAVK